MTNNNNQYYIPKLPETSTVAYFDIETGHWTDEFLSYFSQGDRRKLARMVRERIEYHKGGNSVQHTVCNKNNSPVFWDPEREERELAKLIIDWLEAENESMDSYCWLENDHMRGLNPDPRNNFLD
ncbi:MAG: hypothetical protein mread185_000457 [Mycoplasmataceae bacterium]|nr:MAG: hypothetical protein mread185_000457 [Mycoplasmataceae bacterium]